MSCGRELEELEEEAYIVAGEWLIGMYVLARNFLTHSHALA